MSRILPFLDLKPQYREIREEVLAAVERVFESSQFSGGSFVEAFENHFASFCNTAHCCGVNNGTSALHLALLALGVGKGDEVVVPANSFIATAWAPHYAGATPVFVDCDPATWNIDPGAVEAAVTPRTRAVVGVHLYGQPFDVDAVAAVARKHGLPLVEDAAQAHGARYKGRVVGGLGDAACFSFYPAKNLGAYGAGGAVTTADPGIDRQVRLLRNHGTTVRGHHDVVGFNMRMDDVQAAILDVKLARLPDWNRRRREIARAYRDGLRNPGVRAQREPEWAESCCHLFVVVAEDRKSLLEHLAARGIVPGIHYPVPCHLQEAFRPLGYVRGSLPVSEHLADHCLSLPMYPELLDSDVQRVIEAVNGWQP